MCWVQGVAGVVGHSIEDCSGDMVEGSFDGGGGCGGVCFDVDCFVVARAVSEGFDRVYFEGHFGMSVEGINVGGVLALAAMHRSRPVRTGTDRVGFDIRVKIRHGGILSTLKLEIWAICIYSKNKIVYPGTHGI